MSPAKRAYGTGNLYEKHGAWYGRWRTTDGRRFNRRIGPVRSVGEADGLTRRQAERQFRRLQDAEERNPTPVDAGRHTVADACEALRHKKVIEGASRSHLANCERYLRLHIGPAIGTKKIDKVTRHDVEALAEKLLGAGQSPKSVRDTLVYLNGAFEYAIDLEWTQLNPVRRATSPSAGGPATPTRTCSSSRSRSSRLCCARSPTTSSSVRPSRSVRGAAGRRRRHPTITSGRCCGWSC
jgi:hypothetical protein